MKPNSYRAEVGRKQGSGHDREEESEEAQESGRQRSHGYRAVEKRTHPTEEKSPERTEAPIQVNVVAAGFGKGCTQFGVAERAEEDDQAADDPGGENQGDRSDGAGHVAGDQKDAGTDHVADDDGGGRPEAETADEVRRLRPIGCGRIDACHEVHRAYYPSSEAVKLAGAVKEKHRRLLLCRPFARYHLHHYGCAKNGE